MVTLALMTAIQPQSSKQQLLKMVLNQGLEYQKVIWKSHDWFKATDIIGYVSPTVYDIPCCDAPSWHDITVSGVMGQQKGAGTEPAYRWVGGFKWQS